jgi:transposase
LLFMGMQGKKSYQEKLFTNFQLSDRVPVDNFYRRLKDVLDLQWVYKATSKYYGKEGQASIDPVVFFKLILIGYLEDQASDRRIINSVSMRLDMLYFIGYDIDEPLPWHSTLSRTRQLYGEEVFRQLFRQVLKQCIEKGMVAGRRQAVDSVFVKANASIDSMLEKEVLADGDVYTASLKEAEQKENSNVDDAGAGIRTNKTHYSKTDPDARLSTKPGKPTRLNYLAQVSVDTGGHVITNIEAHHADKRDSECLGSVVTNMLQNLLPEGLIVEELLADANYSSGRALQALENNNITGYIPNNGLYQPEREGFTYDKQKDQYTCSQGAILKYKRIFTTKEGYSRKEYQGSSQDCPTCSIREQCTGRSPVKRITHTVDKPLYDQMLARMQTNKAMRMRKLRQSTAEPVLGTLINFLGMGRLNTRGIEQAGKCMLMAAISYNLKKLLKHTASRTHAAVKVMQKLTQRGPQMLTATLCVVNYRYQQLRNVLWGPRVDQLVNFLN